ELHQLGIDIAALSETRLSETGSLDEVNYHFCWSGKPDNEPRIHGVGFSVEKSVLSACTSLVSINERIMWLDVNTNSGTLTLLSIYGPTLDYSKQQKDEFFFQLEQIIKKVPARNRLAVLGDFNARVGKDWGHIIGQHGTGSLNENGQRALELCASCELIVSNTYFAGSNRSKVTWRHPHSGHWHQLDLILIRRKNIRDVLHARSMHSADCDTDHALVRAKLQLHPKKIHDVKLKNKPCLNIINMKDSDTCAKFQCTLECVSGNDQSDSPDSDTLWENFKNKILVTAKDVFRTTKKKQPDWFAASEHLLLPLIEKKRQARLTLLQQPTKSRTLKFKEAKAAVQKATRECAQKYWQDLCKKIQICFERGDLRGTYDGIKEALGPTCKKTGNLKAKDGTILTDRKEQLDRWTEHYKEPYSKDAIICDTALAAIPQLPTMQELDQTPTLEDVEKAIRDCTWESGRQRSNTSGAPKGRGRKLASDIHALLCTCWEESHIPQDPKDAKIITLYKNKGDRADCNNCQGISLLSVVGKVLARVLLKRLQVLAERVYPESQCGFRAGCSTTDMSFTLCLLQEKSHEQQAPLYVAFVDLQKAFDTVSRNGIYKILSKIGCPQKVLSLFKEFHEGMKAIIQYENETSSEFSIDTGMKYAFGNDQSGVLIESRMDGSLFNIRRLQSKRHVTQLTIRDLLFADDAAFVSNSPDELQNMMNKFSDACTKFGMVISIKKTVVMSQGTNISPKIYVNNEALDNVDHFCYFGSTLTSSLSLESVKLLSPLADLPPCVWNNKLLTLNTKVSVYQACVLSTLLYGCESWVTYSKQERRLNSF
uniref:Reverse transcriptase domain-containing protein n=1 Tax=Latimeria chalumnae TaxID=7897 RepID=H3B828_LATCH